MPARGILAAMGGTRAQRGSPAARGWILLAVVLALAAYGCSAKSSGDPRPMRIESVQLDPATRQPVLLLIERGGEQRELLIWIGHDQAASIAMALRELSPPRPNAHDLIKTLVAGIEGRVERVVVTELRDNTYYAVIDLRVNGRRVSIDSRPSDAIAVAVRTGAEVFAMEALLQEAGESDAGPPVEIDWRNERPRSL